MSHRSPRPALCALVGAAGAGKRTLCLGLADLLGGDHVTVLALDDYVAHDRESSARQGISPFAPGAAHLDLMAQHLRLMRQGETVFKPVYDRAGGRFAEPEFIRPSRIVLAHGMHGLDTPELRAMWDVTLFVASEREDADSARYIGPQRERADATLSVHPAKDADGLVAELRIAHPVPLHALDDLQHDPICAPHFQMERAANGADVIEISGRVDDVSRRHIEARLLAALPDAAPRRQLRLGIVPDAAPGDRRSNLLALTQLVVAQYFVQKGRLRQPVSPEAARSAHPVPGA
jgi:phosphoribulokinase